MNKKKKLMVVLDAGASIESRMPSVNAVDEVGDHKKEIPIVKSWVRLILVL